MRSPWSDASSSGAAPTTRQRTQLLLIATNDHAHKRPPEATGAAVPDPSGSCGPRERTSTCVSPPRLTRYARRLKCTPRSRALPRHHAGTACPVKLEEPLTTLKSLSAGWGRCGR